MPVRASTAFYGENLMKNPKRRHFLKTAAAAALGVATASCTPRLNKQPARREGDGEKRYGMVIDLAKCIGCQACVVSCRIENSTPPAAFRTSVDQYRDDDGKEAGNVMLPRLCNHCDNPPCVPVCPVQATFQRLDGVVVIDNTRCVGCGYCVVSCPYNARFLNPVTNTADKCTFCLHRLEQGLLPACVESCVGGARMIGDLNDPESQVSQLLAAHRGKDANGRQRIQLLREKSGTEPRVYYLGLSDEFTDTIEGSPSIYSLHTGEQHR